MTIDIRTLTVASLLCIAASPFARSAHASMPSVVVSTTIRTPCPIAGTCFLVTNTRDAGPGSLRQAILDANATSGITRIGFAIPGEGPFYIRPQDRLPALGSDIILDGYTQPGATRGTEDSAPQLQIVLSGGRSLVNEGLYVEGENVEVTGLVLHEWDTAAIFVYGSNATIRGNILGLDSTGQEPLGRGWFGVAVVGEIETTIGGVAPEERNVIGGLGEGIYLSHAHGNRIIGNSIGTDYFGTVDLGNAYTGVSIVSGDNNEVGGVEAGEANIIAHNDEFGVRVFSGWGNMISRNAIFDSDILNIDLGVDELTPNDGPGDLDIGANDLQNHPRLLAATLASDGRATLDWGLRSTPSALFRVEFFAGTDCGQGARGEARRFLGSRAIRTDASGEVRNLWTLPGRVTEGELLTATATNIADGNTSELARCLEVPPVSEDPIDEPSDPSDEPSDPCESDGYCEVEASGSGR